MGEIPKTLTAATETRSLVKKIAEVMKAVGGVPKTGYNKFHQYAYAKETDILDAVRDELAKRHVIIVPSVETYDIRDVKTQKGEDRLTSVLMKFTAMDGESGETFSFGMLGQGQDPGDKGAYKAETGAEKYAVKKLFMLGDDADPEGDGKTDESHAKPKAAPSKPATPKPVAHEKILEAFKGYGIERDAIEQRIGKDVRAANEKDAADLRAWLKDLKALASESAEQKAKRLEQEAAEKGIEAERAFKAAQNVAAAVASGGEVGPAVSKEVARNAAFTAMALRLKEATTPDAVTLILAEAPAEKLFGPGEVKALTRCADDRRLILKDAAERAAKPRKLIIEKEADVPF